MEKAWAAIDIGTNSVRLLIRKKAGQGWKEEKKVCITQLGQGLSREKHLCQEAIARTEDAVLAFAQYAVAQGAQRPIWCYATSAARQADNGKAFLQRLSDSGWVMAELLSGEEEAKAAYLGCRRGLHRANDRKGWRAGGAFYPIGMRYTERKIPKP